MGATYLEEREDSKQIIEDYYNKEKEQSDRILELELECSANQMYILRKTISSIDDYLLEQCINNNVKYRVHERLHDIGRYPHFDDVHYHKLVGKERSEFLDSIWSFVSYRSDLVYKYRAYYGNYILTIEKMRGKL